jgi:hypothetical protein
MSIQEARTRIQARAWRDIAQSGLDLSPLPRPTLEALVDLVSDAALLEIDDELAATLKREPAPALVAQEAAEASVTGEDEQILWEGRPFLTITIRYLITNQRVRIIEGLIGKTREDIELVKIQDMSQSQTVRERLLNLGDITIRSSDRSHPVVVLDNIKDPQAVHETLRRAVLKAREEHGLRFREQM